MMAVVKNAFHKQTEKSASIIRPADQRPVFQAPTHSCTLAERILGLCV